MINFTYNQYLLIDDENVKIGKLGVKSEKGQEIP